MVHRLTLSHGVLRPQEGLFFLLDCNGRKFLLMII